MRLLYSHLSPGDFMVKKRGRHMSHNCSIINQTSYDGKHPMKDMIAMFVGIFHGMIMGQFTWNRHGKVTSCWAFNAMNFPFYSMKQIWENDLGFLQNYQHWWIFYIYITPCPFTGGSFWFMTLSSSHLWFGENLIRLSPHELRIFEARSVKTVPQLTI